ncbi:helix-turn-helix domain-containing protein [Streptomyces sp. B6B3]|uniref:ArsR/SmtB family transcription factor n=1 Tax=Streptomyces sp. B6B3 TaxID=3153570 RepID=UPI00325D1DBD
MAEEAPGGAGTDGGGRRTISDPAALKALAHPLRLRILRHLGAEGPATSTTLAGSLGESTGTLSYHLRQLERGGFIEDIPERSTGRERWWRGVRGLDVRQPPYDEMTASERAVAGALDRLRMAEDVELAKRFVAEAPESEGWMRGSRSLSHLTREELDAFHDAYLELLARFARGPEDAPPGARPVLLRWFGLPAD